MNYDKILSGPVGNYMIRQVWTWGDIIYNIQKHQYHIICNMSEVSELYEDQVGHCLDNYNNITRTKDGYQL